MDLPSAEIVPRLLPCSIYLEFALPAAMPASSTPYGHFNVLYFAGASSYTGRDREAWPAPLPLAKLFAELESKYPGFKDTVLDSCMVTINLDYVDINEGGDDGPVIQESDEVAIIPPVSSG
ncbi:hypothetical protein E4U53_003585 [Claviceps sorghi]|nr:hypothetical protein E4U53_003585 [Claviceps sorghi]